MPAAVSLSAAKRVKIALCLVACFLGARADQCSVDQAGVGQGCEAGTRAEAPDGSMMLQSKARTRMISATTDTAVDRGTTRFEVATWPGQKIVEMQFEEPGWVDQKLAEIQLEIARTASLVEYERRLVANKTDAEFIDLLKKLYDAFKALEPCLRKEEKYNVLALFNFFSNQLNGGVNVPKVAIAFYEEYVEPAVQSGLTWINAEMDAGFSKVKGTFQSDMDEGDAVAMIATALSEVSLDKIPMIIDEVWNLQMRLLSQPGWLPVYCIQQHVVQPFKETIKTELQNFLTNIVEPVQKWITDMMTSLGNWVADVMFTLMEKFKTEEWDKRLAEQLNETAAESCTETLNQAYKDLQTAAKNNNVDELKNIDETFSARLPAKLLGRVGAAGLSLLLNDMFGWLMRTIVDPAVEWLQGGLQTLYNSMLHVVNGLVGLAPIAGDAVASMISSGVEQIDMFINDQTLVKQVEIWKGTLKHMCSYEYLQTPMASLFGEAGTQFDAGFFGMVSGVLNSIGITDTNHWINGTLTGLEPIFLRVSDIVIPEVSVALQDCMDGRKAIATQARDLAEALDPTMALVQRAPYEGDHPALLEMADAFHKQQLAHSNWVLDIPFKPTKPEHIDKWRRESKSLLQEYDDYVANFKYSAGGNTDSEEEEEEEQVSLATTSSQASNNGKTTRTGSRTASVSGKRKRKTVSSAVHWDPECVAGTWRWDQNGHLGMCDNEKCSDVKYYWDWKWQTKRVCVNVPFPCWKFGWLDKPAKSCQYGKILGIEYHWCPTKGEIKKEDFLWIGNFKKCLDDTNWLDQVIIAARAMPNIWEMAKGILGCLGNMQGADNEKWKIESLIDFYVGRAADPLQLFKDIFATYVKPTLDPFVDWIKAKVLESLNSAKVLINAIGDGNLMSVGTKFVKEQIMKGWDMLTNETTGIMSLPGMGPAICLKRHFLVPVFEPMIPSFTDNVVKIVTPLAEFVQKTLKALMDWMNGMITEVMEGDTWVTTIAKVVKNSVLRVCLEQLKPEEEEVQSDESTAAALLRVDGKLEDEVDDESSMHDRDEDNEGDAEGHSTDEGRWGHRHHPHHPHNPHAHNPHSHTPIVPTPDPTPAPTPEPTPAPTPVPCHTFTTSDECADHCEWTNSTCIVTQQIGGVKVGAINLLETGVKVINTILKKAKDYVMTQLVAPLAKKINFLATKVSGLILHGTDATMGLIPFAGGLIGSISSIASDMAKSISTWFGFKSLYGAMDKLFDLGLNWVRQKINEINLGTDSFIAVMMDGPFGVVIKFLLDKIQGAMKLVGVKMMQECSSSVKAAEETKKVTVKVQAEQTPAPTPPPTAPPPTPEPLPKEDVHGLAVKIVNASNLLDMDKKRGSGTSEPYCKVVIRGPWGEEELCQTVYKVNDENPEWNKVCETEKEVTSMDFVTMDKDRKADDPLGTYSWTSEEGGFLNGQRALQLEGEEDAGSILVSIVPNSEKQELLGTKELI